MLKAGLLCVLRDIFRMLWVSAVGVMCVLFLLLYYYILCYVGISVCDLMNRNSLHLSGLKVLCHDFQLFEGVCHAEGICIRLLN